MARVKKNRCHCGKTAIFGKSIGLGVHCSLHKEKDDSDVVNKRCEICQLKRAYYGTISGKPVRCKDHKQLGDWYVSIKACRNENCNIRPYFGTKITGAIHCVIHKDPHEYDVRHRMCASCGLFRVDKKKDTMCNYCDPSKSTKFHTKEREVLEFLRSQVQPISTFTRNKSIGFSCGNFRPDILYDAHTHFVVVEVDEEQHKQYDKNCEEVRMKNIRWALGLPTVFIRFNPDHYQPQPNLSSHPFQTRLEHLRERIQYYYFTTPTQDLIIEYMYYDTS
jgi:hypothetical protein